MRFTLLDRITELQAGVRIQGTKSLTLAEEYLADHFPLFPVMPGVLMLEAMTQCSAWLVRASEDFAHSIVTLAEARAVKYADFVKPGQTLTVTAELLGHDERVSKLKVHGAVNGSVNVSARLTLCRYNLADLHPDRAASDVIVRAEMRKLFSLLYQPAKAGTKAHTNGASVPLAATL
ncbi:MAG: 3-hydroxyacyl-ACP dehydratase FabZ family protein [Pirellulales bacterium]